MKRMVCVLMLLLLLTGCAKGGREFNGEILSFNRVDGDGEVYSFQLLRQDGKELEMFLREDTYILCWVDTLSREDFLEGDQSGLQVNVEYEKLEGMYFADGIDINAQRFEKAMTLEDGTPIDVVEKMFGSREYCLEDGTVLLYERDRVGPENMGGAPFAYDDLNEQVQEKVSAYYNAKVPHYQLEKVLEDAYDKWYLMKDNRKDFTGDSVSCDIYPSAINERLIFYGSEMWLPGENNHEIIREGAVFDRETGEWISSFDLINCDVQTLLDAIFELTKIEDEVLKKEIRAAIAPEKIIFESDGISLWFTGEDLPEYGSSFGTGVRFQDGIRQLMHEWAIPVSEKE